MIKVYVVLDASSLEFYGAFTSWEQAWTCAETLDSTIVEYELGADGKWHNVDGEW